MKKICIVSFCNIYVLPYARTYLDSITQNGSECTLLFWDRDGVHGDNDDYPNCKKLVYSKKIAADASRLTKIFCYRQAIGFIRKALRTQSFDGAIFLQTHAAVVCQDILRKEYFKRYIIDIRDYTCENIGVYRGLEEKAIKAAYQTVISSPAYAEFLPKQNYVVAHNYSEFPSELVHAVRERPVKKADEPINITFIGTVRFFDINREVLNLFANDNRFQINYYGTGSEVLRGYCEENRITNVDFCGSFQPNQTTELYEKTDLINNLYGNHRNTLDYALSNKLYHSAQFCIPILVCPETYMERVSSQYNMGFVFDVNDNSSPDRLIKWYKEFDRSLMRKGCDEFIDVVKKENVAFYEMIQQFALDIQA